MPDYCYNRASVLISGKVYIYLTGLKFKDSADNFEQPPIADIVLCIKGEVNR